MLKKYFNLMLIICFCHGWPKLLFCEEVDKVDGICDNSSRICLTFDDCYTNWLTIASRYEDCTFTFFVSGEALPYRVAIVQKLIKNNHSIQNHSISHTNLNKITKPKREAFLESDILRQDQLLQRLGASKPTVFAFPYGCTNRDWNNRLLSHYQKLRGVGTLLNLPYYYSKKEFDETKIIKSVKLYNYRFFSDRYFCFYVDRMIAKLKREPSVVVLTSHQIGKAKYGIKLERLDYLVKKAKENGIMLTSL